jgi:hypothetical protein
MGWKQREMALTWAPPPLFGATHLFSKLLLLGPNNTSHSIGCGESS